MTLGVGNLTSTRQLKSYQLLSMIEGDSDMAAHFSVEKQDTGRVRACTEIAKAGQVRGVDVPLTIGV